MHFDWYQGTVPVTLENFVITMCQRNPGLDFSEARPEIRQYQEGADFHFGGEKFFHACWGGCNESKGIHFKSTGGGADDFSKSIREHFPGHAVSRVDVAVDYDEPGVFESLKGFCLSVAKKKNIKVGAYGDWFTDSGDGRTLYIGSKDSAVRARLYEKGLEQKAKGSDLDFPDWTRLEFQIRPRSSHKAFFAALSPADAARYSGWSDLIMQNLARLEISQVDMPKVWRLEDNAKAHAHLLKQYAPTIKKYAENNFGNDRAEYFKYLEKKIFGDNEVF